MKTFKTTLWITLLILLVGEWLFPNKTDAHEVWLQSNIVHVLIGFLSAFILMAAAKGLGTFFLYRKENYYDQ